MTEYKYGSGEDSTKKGGSTQPRPSGEKGSNYGGSGAIPAVVGKTSPVVAEGGATNNGGKRS